MRIALKIAAWMLLVLLVVQAVMGLHHMEREADIVEAELRRDHRILGAALVTALEDRPEGAATMGDARRLLDAVAFAEREIGLRITAGAPAARSQVMEGPELVTSLPVHLATVDAQLELREPLVEVARVTHEGWVRLGLGGSLTLALGLVAAALGGQLVVGRRMEALAQRAGAIGAGDLAPRDVSDGTDEIHEVGRALEQLAAQLTRARAVADAEQAARQRAVKQLRHADRLRLVGDLSAGVAHELGSPLHVVIGNAKHLDASEALSAVGREALEDIVHEAERMDRLVRRLLELAHPEPPGGVRTALADLWDPLRAAAEGLTRGTGVSLSLAPPPAAEIPFQPAHFVQVTANLVRNAIQAQPEGGAVRVWAAAEPSGVAVYVEDDGPGVAPDLRERIFAPFFTTKAPGAGVGLGLPLVRGLVEEAGGTVQVDAAPSGGARFCLRFPTPEPL